MLLVVIVLFAMASKHSAEVLPRVSKCTMAMMCLTEKLCELDQTCISVLLAVSSVLLNQQSQLNKVSLTRITENKVMY